MHYTMISGFANIRKELIRTSLENDILITSYDALKRDIDVYRTMEFSCQVIDEAQLYTREDGQTISVRLRSFQAASKDMIWIDLPKPISSASNPPR